MSGSSIFKQEAYILWNICIPPKGKLALLSYYCRLCTYSAFRKNVAKQCIPLSLRKSKASEPNGSAFNGEIYPWGLSLVWALISQKADKEHWIFLFSVPESCHTASAETAVHAGYEMCFSSLVRNFNFCAWSEILVGISMTSCIKWTQNNCGSEAQVTPSLQQSLQATPIAAHCLQDLGYHSFKFWSLFFFLIAVRCNRAVACRSTWIYY